MKKLIQIIYVSRSTSPSTQNGQGIEPGIARILAKSRANNRKNGLVGVLYFGDGCFFQCLEGEEEAIDNLYSKLQVDNRHASLELISRKEVMQLSFGAWSMKYILSEQKIKDLLREEQLTSFDPYQFSESGIRKMLALLHEASDVQNPAASYPSLKHNDQTVSVTESTNRVKQERNRPNWPMLYSALIVIVVSTIGIFFVMH